MQISCILFIRQSFLKDICIASKASLMQQRMTDAAKDDRYGSSFSKVFLCSTCEAGGIFFFLLTIVNLIKVHSDSFFSFYWICLDILQIRKIKVNFNQSFNIHFLSPDSLHFHFDCDAHCNGIGVWPLYNS